MVPFNPKRVDKEWGYEVWLANNKDEDYCGKILFIEEGKSTSMHYHVDKHETFYVIDGTLRVDMLRHKDKPDHHPFTMTCKEGESMEMKREQPHKLIAAGGNVTIIEISKFHRDEDSHRIKLT
jgi:mannose-6-phosphate isomerase-like protein (cupin superfamily)